MKHPNHIVNLSGKLYNFRSSNSIPQLQIKPPVIFEINAKYGFTEINNQLQPNYNNCSISNNQFVFDNQHYFSYDVSNLTNKIDFGTDKDFTIQCVCRMTSQPDWYYKAPFVNSDDWSNGAIMIQYNGSGRRFGLFWHGVCQELYSNNYYNDLPTTKELFHLALVRQKDKIMTFVNGKQDVTTYSTSGVANFASKSGYLYIGYNAVYGDFFNGNMKYLKIYDYAKYTEDFNVTKLLYIK